MGTTISLALHDAPPGLVNRFFDQIRLFEAVFTRFRPGSEILRLERDELSLDEASPEVREVLSRCESLRLSTDGAFDHRPVGTDGPILDPNAFVKGWIIEQAALFLRMSGVSSYFVNAGGDIAVGAPPPGRKSWRIGIRHPRNPDAVFAHLELNGATLATSGEYERGSHIRDCPQRDGTSSQLATVTVVGPDLAVADALATAVFASGTARPRWWKHDSPYGIVAVSTDGEVRYSQELSRYNLSVSAPARSAATA